MKKTEILAPCGTKEALCAAVKAGADAVYLGGSLFSARAFAGNFDTEDMLWAIDYCHLFDTKIYMAVNTLLKESEIERVVPYMESFYRNGLDGVIVQDMGVASVLRKAFADLPLHASTQMSISSSSGAEFLKRAGFTRVVPARELSLSEIISIKKNVDIEIETFVHGAMCFAYSGKCLLSSEIGGRSGNRGRCAQPCRQCWKMSENKKQIANEYVMSLKDMCLLEHVPELADAGIDSFKIEGRMKKPEYVAQVTRAYRDAVDMYMDGAWNEANIEQLVKNLKDLYNRGGFSTGYYFTLNGRNMLADKRPNHTGLKVGSVNRISPPDVFIKLNEDVNAQDVFEIRSSAGSVELTSPSAKAAGETLVLKGKEFKSIRKGAEVFRMRNNKLIDDLHRDIMEPEKYIEAECMVEAKVGEPLAISIWSKDINITVKGSVVEKASNRPADSKTVSEKMQKTGGSGVRLKVNCLIAPDCFIQMSELNALRRSAVEEFKKAKCQKKYRNKDENIYQNKN